MDSQINSLETRIEKMQERFNKYLEEIKKSQYIINNAINDIKNTLEGTKGFLPQPVKDLESLSSTRLEALVPSRVGPGHTPR